MKIVQIMNYLTNACKYTDRGSIKVSVALADSKTMILCKVTDTGVGVRTALRQQLFDPFSEIQKHQKEGTGIGLWSVKLHCEGLGGSCGMQPNPDADSGSVFWFKVCGEIFWRKHFDRSVVGALIWQITYTPDFTAATHGDNSTSPSKGVHLALEVRN